MRKTVAVAATTGALLLGGAGVAHATPAAPAPSSTTTSLAQDNPSDNNCDRTGLWGLLGLLGLAGLTLVKRRDGDYRQTGTTGAPGGGTIRPKP